MPADRTPPQLATTPPARPEQLVAGAWRLGTHWCNFYVVEEQGRLTIVDTAMPGYWDILVQGLAQLGCSLDDVDAVVLTHAHDDHRGMAERIRTTANVPVYVHEDDARLARGEMRPDAGLPNPLHRHFLRFCGHAVRNGFLRVPKVREVTTFTGGDQLDVPGRPRIVHLPGHTAGHCAVTFPDRGLAIVGDAIATLAIVTGRRGPTPMPRQFHANEQQADASLRKVADLDADVIAVGHGFPWRGSPADMVALVP